MPSAITVDHLEKSFVRDGEGLRAIDGISLHIERGELFVLLGPSGCGKSTLLRILAGLDRADRGTVAFGDQRGAQRVSFVFQQFALLPWLDVSENIALGLLACGMSPTEREHRVQRELERFQLTQFAHASPYELSGGMRQRVGIARAFATDPEIVCMDEPFSELDSFTAMELRRELLAIWQERKPTIIMVTHLIPEAIELADRIAVLTPRPARIEATIAVDLPRPRNKRSPTFFALEDRLSALVKP